MTFNERIVADNEKQGSTKPRVLLDIRSPLHSHEKQFPTLYDLCKIDLPNGRTDAASLVTLTAIRGDLWSSLIFELGARVPSILGKILLASRLRKECSKYVITCSWSFKFVTS